MISKRKRYVFLTDTHIKFFGRYKLLNTILDQHPHGVFLTGDISEGPTFLSDLEFLGSRIGRPLYFVHGNHELWFSSFEKVKTGIQKLCYKYQNLIWMTRSGIVPLNKKTAVVGTEGWYDGRGGNSDYIKYTFDWFLIKEFRKLPNMKARLEMMREIADKSAKMMVERLEEAMENYKSVYLLTHMPPWIEANRADGLFSEAFWAPYHCNIIMGQELERAMKKYKKRNLIVLCGHTHQPLTIQVSRNIECRVGRGSYIHVSDEDLIYI